MFKCSACDKYLVGETKRLICAECKIKYYCSKECQKNHWKGHKSDCASLVEHFKGESFAMIHKDVHHMRFSLIYPDADSSKKDEAADLAYKSEKKKIRQGCTTNIAWTNSENTMSWSRLRRKAAH